MNRVIIPLDVSSVSGALALVDQLGDGPTSIRLASSCTREVG